VVDDSGQHYRRGERISVSAEKHAVLTAAAYRESFIDPEASAPAASPDCCAEAAPTVKSPPPGNNRCCG
jgi:hypothetical protein